MLDLSNIDVLNEFHTQLIETIEDEKPRILLNLSNYFIKLASFCTINPPVNQDRLRFPIVSFLFFIIVFS